MKNKNIIGTHNKNIILLIIMISGILFIVSTYAWFSTNLNVKIDTFKMTVKKNLGLSISLDGINFDTSIEVSRETLIDELKNTYPNNTSQWSDALVPVSSNGITNHNSPNFNIFTSSGIRYPDKTNENGYVTTFMAFEEDRNPYNSYIAFDVFFKNDSGSPVSDNLYFDYGTEVTMEDQSDEEMVGLLNSTRVGIVKIGSTSKDAPIDTIQNLSCNNNCYSIIYEPNSTSHTDLSIERATKYGLNLVNGRYYETYAFKKAGGPVFVEYSISGSPYIDPAFFQLQETITEDDFNNPLFTVPDGITKARMYVWIEGQDIDSLETDSNGAEFSFSINFVKDTQGYE